MTLHKYGELHYECDLCGQTFRSTNAEPLFCYRCRGSGVTVRKIPLYSYRPFKYQDYIDRAEVYDGREDRVTLRREGESFEVSGRRGEWDVNLDGIHCAGLDCPYSLYVRDYPERRIKT